jgi:TnsA endonuclease-like protein
MMADFDRSVKRIASQPFQLRHCTNGVIHRRVPDYLLCTENGPVVIDVVRSARLQDPGIRQKLEMTRRVIESRGWRYEIASDPPPVRYLNIRFLSGYRRPWQFDPEVIVVSHYLGHSLIQVDAERGSVAFAPRQESTRPIV